MAEDSQVFVGASKCFLDIVEKIRPFAACTATVLITGKREPARNCLPGLFMIKGGADAAGSFLSIARPYRTIWLRMSYSGMFGALLQTPLARKTVCSSRLTAGHCFWTRSIP